MSSMDSRLVEAGALLAYHGRDRAQGGLEEEAALRWARAASVQQEAE